MMKQTTLLPLLFVGMCALNAADKLTLPNGSFEELNDAGTWPLHWEFKPQNKGKLGTADAADGKYFLRFEDGYGVLEYRTTVAAPANAELEMSASVRGGDGCKFGMLALYKIQNAHTGKTQFYTHKSVWDEPLTGEWRKVSGKIKLREDAVSGELIIAFYRSNRTGFLDLDDVAARFLPRPESKLAAPAPATVAAAAPNVPAAGAAVAPPNLRLTLPEVIYAAPLFESNIFFENVVDTANPGAYAVEVKCPVGNHYANRWSWTPRNEDAGKSFDLELRLFNDYGMVISGKTRIVVAREAEDPGRPIRLALLGDSLLLCKYPEHLRDTMLKTGFKNYVPVGSYTPSGEIPKPGDMAHDAYGGFAWSDFLRRWKYSAQVVAGVQDAAEREQMIALGVIDVPKSDDYRMRSPLLRLEKGQKVLDIPNWLNRINGGKAPEFIIIELGGNDVFGASSAQLDEWVAAAMRSARTLLAELRKHAPESQIGVTTAQVGCSQDGFGLNYGCRQSSYQYRRNIQRYNREIAKLVRELNDPAIELVPIHQNIDSVNSYIKADRPVHKRSKISRPTDVNALHPNLEGGYQVGDAIYCWLRKKLEK